MRYAVAVVAGLSVILLTPGCGAGDDQAASNSETTVSERQPVPETLTVGRWRFRVTVKPSRLGPIAFEAKNLTRLKRSSSPPWIEHDLVFRNTGDRPITFDDTRSSTFIGDAGHDRLLAADEGCGYGVNYPGAPAKAGVCQLNLDDLAVKPHGSARRSIRLTWGLRGMEPLVEGTYVFRRPVRFQPGSQRPTGGEGRSGIVRLVYQVDRHPE